MELFPSVNSEEQITLSNLHSFMSRRGGLRGHATALANNGWTASDLGSRGMATACANNNCTASDLGSRGMATACANNNCTASDLGSHGMATVLANNGWTASDLASRGMATACANNNCTASDLGSRGMATALANNGWTTLSESSSHKEKIDKHVDKLNAIKRKRQEQYETLNLEKSDTYSIYWEKETTIWRVNVPGMTVGKSKVTIGYFARFGEAKGARDDVVDAMKMCPRQAGRYIKYNYDRDHQKTIATMKSAIEAAKREWNALPATSGNSKSRLLLLESCASVL